MRLFSKPPILFFYLCLSAFCSGAGTGILASDDFEPRANALDGATLDGLPVQSSRNGASYSVPVHQSATLILDAGRAVPDPFSPSPNASNAFPLEVAPTPRPLRLIVELQVSPPELMSGTLPGFFAGFSASSAELLNNVRETVPHLALRFVPVRKNRGRFELILNDGKNEPLRIWSRPGVAVDFEPGDTVGLVLEYDPVDRKIFATAGNRANDWQVLLEFSAELPPETFATVQLDITGLNKVHERLGEYPSFGAVRVETF